MQTLVSHENTEALFRYYIWHIKMEVSKHCIVTQSVCVMQPYPSLWLITNRNKSLGHKMPFKILLVIGYASIPRHRPKPSGCNNLTCGIHSVVVSHHRS